MGIPLNKAGLAKKRAELIEAERKATSTRERVDIQRQLTEVNADIKRLNKIESAEAKHDADIRRALGNQEHQANERRRLELAERASKPGMERDEGILIRAKQLLRDMERHPAAPGHFAQFTIVLKGFIEAQKDRMKAPGEPETPTEDAQWRETWTDK